MVIFPLSYLLKFLDCYIVKCALDVDHIDLNLDYSKALMNIKEKEKIEHTLILEQKRFDTFAIPFEEFHLLKKFFTLSLNSFLNKKKV